MNINTELTRDNSDPPGAGAREVERRDGAKSVFASLPRGFPHVPFAGRLDRDTSGLLLFSDDGQLTNGLIDPSCKGEGWAALRGNFSMVLGRNLYVDLSADFAKNSETFLHDSQRSPIPQLVLTSSTPPAGEEIRLPQYGLF